MSDIYENYCNVVQKNNRFAQIGIYSVALVGLSVALRRVRPFTRFSRPSDVPQSFIKRRRELNGFVRAIEPNGAILMVEHKPLIPLPRSEDPNELLPVKMADLNVTQLGINWLQAIVAKSEVTFIPIRTTSNALECEIYMPQVNNKVVENINIAESLAIVGFATTTQNSKQQPPTTVSGDDDRMHRVYVSKLQSAETKALKRQLGRMQYYLRRLGGPPYRFVVGWFNFFVKLVR